MSCDGDIIDPKLNQVLPNINDCRIYHNKEEEKKTTRNVLSSNTRVQNNKSFSILRIEIMD